MNRIKGMMLSLILIVGLNPFVQLMAVDQPSEPAMIQEADVIVNPEIINNLPGTDDEKEPLLESMPVCAPGSTFKSWMDYRKITSKSSRQWKLQQEAYTDDQGFRRIGDYYMVAMARQYGPVGEKYLITFSSGASILAIIGDIKGGTSCQHKDSSMVEFILEADLIAPVIRRSGNVNKVYEGTVISIHVVPGE